MKKIDLKLVVTDENGKDNTLSLFVPIAEGQEKKECGDFLDTVSLFINKQLNQEIKNSFHFGGVEFNYSKLLTVKEIPPMKQVLSSEKKELFQEISPVPIIVNDCFIKNETSFIVNRFTDSKHGLHYGLYLYGRNLVSTQVSNPDVFYKVTSVNDNVSAYIDIDKNKLCSENLYISELSIIKIMERFDISFSEFKEKVLTCDKEDYCMEEILEKEIKNPDLKSHQLEDIKEILATASEVREIIARGDENE